MPRPSVWYSQSVRARNIHIAIITQCNRSRRRSVLPRIGRCRVNRDLGLVLLGVTLLNLPSQPHIQVRGHLSQRNQAAGHCVLVALVPILGAIELLPLIPVQALRRDEATCVDPREEALLACPGHERCARTQRSAARFCATAPNQKWATDVTEFNAGG